MNALIALAFLVGERPAGSATHDASRMADWDWREINDETLAQLCVFHVPDKPVQHQ
ncbi:unnamed protein product, partial [Nippostrongylus brasiliensis]|uniref:Transposase n=1 Tax=Nippostrongylus brasiliensis TaxID=27835 RepID=A0A0N4XNU4_NIPBR